MTSNKEKDFKDEVALTRGLVAEREHGALLAWGITAAAVGMVIYLCEWLTGCRLGWLWALVPAVAGPVHGYVDRKNDKDVKLTPLYMMLGRIGRIAVSLIIAAALLTIIFDFNAYCVILLILSVWCGFSGFMLDYPRLWQLAIGGLAMSVAIGLKSPDAYELPVFAIGLCVTLVAPGLDMLRRAKKHISNC